MTDKYIKQSLDVSRFYYVVAAQMGSECFVLFPVDVNSCGHAEESVMDEMSVIGSDKGIYDQLA